MTLVLVVLAATALAVLTWRRLLAWLRSFPGVEGDA